MDPGRFSILHTAYGRIGNLDAGGVEIIGYDTASGQYTSHFFSSQGHMTVDQLSYDGGEWRLAMDVTLRKID